MSSSTASPSSSSLFMAKGRRGSLDVGGSSPSGGGKAMPIGGDDDDGTFVSFDCSVLSPYL